MPTFTLDLRALSPSELVDRFEQQARQLGYCTAKGEWGMVGGLRTTSTQVKGEILRRLGAAPFAEVLNRSAFVWLAMCRHKAICNDCGRKPMRGRGLEYWTRDKVNPDPLLLIMAHHGASTDKLRVARDDCWVLCHKCATRRGAKLTKNQTPHLKSYGITVTPDLVE